MNWHILWENDLILKSSSNREELIKYKEEVYNNYPCQFTIVSDQYLKELEWEF